MKTKLAWDYYDWKYGRIPDKPHQLLIEQLQKENENLWALIQRLEKSNQQLGLKLHHCREQK